MNFPLLPGPPDEKRLNPGASHAWRLFGEEGPVLRRHIATFGLFSILVIACGGNNSGNSPLPIAFDFPGAAQPCANGRMVCGLGCVDPLTHPQNCGTCGNACTGTDACVAGQCTAACPPEQVECDGLCVVLNTSTDHCGACDTACAAGQVCSNGACTDACAANLAPGPIYTNEGPETSCVNLATDSNNCGKPANVCQGGAACQNGTCTMTCNGSANCAGVCTDVTSNANHCGDCDTACDPDQLCLDGQCVASCPAGLTQCSRSCVDTMNNPSFCGGCFKDCPNAQVCVNGACTADCPADENNCDGACVQLSTSNSNCGKCGSVCGPTDTCVGGTCQPMCNADDLLVR